ncbi:MAG TPA: YihY/virulence factor BrkB family protein, partial [Alphaproteobacteria bacterium]|nr:YihY/virulence factor BrkB family protein [Alphaproteobacteria bacterium]
MKIAIAAWQDNQTARRGAALAFYSVLSLGPLLLLVLAASAWIWGQDAAQGQIMDQMKGLVGEQGASAIQSILTSSAIKKDDGIIATLLGFAMLIFGASGVFGELQDTMNMIWKVKPRADRPWLVIIRERFLSFTMVLGTAFLLLISMVLSAAFAAMGKYASDVMPMLSVLMPIADLLFSFILITLLFAVIFKMVPDVYVPWCAVWPSAALTSLLFAVGKMLIGLYLAHTGVASSYGAAGSVVILLIWIYYSAQILFFGAEFA